MLHAIKGLIKTVHKYVKIVRICNQTPPVYPEVTNFLVRSGIDSISVNPDMVVQTRRLVAQVEQWIILEKLTENSYLDHIGTITIKKGKIR